MPGTAVGPPPGTPHPSTPEQPKTMLSSCANSSRAQCRTPPARSPVRRGAAALARGGGQQHPRDPTLQPSPSHCPRGNSNVPSTPSPLQRPLLRAWEPGAAVPKALAIATVSSRPMSGTTASPTPMSWEGRTW